ncbi:hypothetical protein [Halomonas cerina]|uniref:Phage protein D n=1 Tax=Halomonas cerina TaxID=447424 RepID=A0A839VD39_9GAMM|nr:hypothetical protein [Halomonas cerina]MBB3191870.1 hypothetical protein [Halomonas cerina]
MAAEFRVFLNDEPAEEQTLNLFSQVRVDQAMGMAWEAELHMPVGLDDNGNWSGIDEAFAQPLARVRVEAQVGEGEFVPLIDGPVVGQRFELSGSPNRSNLVLVVHDDSVKLNRDETVQVFEDMAASDIASNLFSDSGLFSIVDNVDKPAGDLGRYIVQRGTPMALLRELARRHGMWVYVRPGDAAGKAGVGVFQRPSLGEPDLPEILIVGAQRNCNQFSARFDALRPATARADSVGIMDVGQRTQEAEDSVLKSLGDKAAHELVEPGRTLLARTRETDDDLGNATQAAVDHSAWAYTAHGEVRAGTYGGVMAPYQTVNVAGAGGYLGGTYLISQVTHNLDDSGYRQQFVLRRNARADATGSGASSIPGGIF